MPLIKNIFSYHIIHHSYPKNKDAFFQRAAAYYETGNFDLALSDYLNSGKKPQKNVPSKTSSDFTSALIHSLGEGALESAQDFIPSLLATTYGLGSSLWSLTEHPVICVTEFSNQCYEMGQCAIDYCKTLDMDKVEGLTQEIKLLYERYDLLNEAEKGHLIGFTIGKYGVDIFAGGTTMKCITAYKKLKDANRICNLETMVVSKDSKQKLINSSLIQLEQREKLIDNVSIHWDKQNKHVPTAHNFIPGRSTIDIPSQRIEYLIKQKAGSGQKIVGEFGCPGYRERVEFNEIIGNFSQTLPGGTCS